MRRITGTHVYSYVKCPHLAALDLQLSRSERRPAQHRVEEQQRVRLWIGAQQAGDRLAVGDVHRPGGREAAAEEHAAAGVEQPERDREYVRAC